MLACAVAFFLVSLTAAPGIPEILLFIVLILFVPLLMIGFASRPGSAVLTEPNEGLFLDPPFAPSPPLSGKRRILFPALSTSLVVKLIRRLQSNDGKGAALWG